MILSSFRFTYRLIPLQNICAAKIDDIVGILESLVSQYVRTHAEALQETKTPVKVQQVGNSCHYLYYRATPVPSTRDLDFAQDQKTQ